MHTTISAAAASAVLCALALAASAQEYCVTCSGPDAKYRCLIGGDAGVAAKSSRGQMLCITQLAQSGGHASCSVSRTTSEPCEGQLKTVMFPAGTELAAPPLAETPQLPAEPQAPQVEPHVTEVPKQVSPTPVPPPPPGVEVPQEAPKTVGEMAEKTAKESAEGLKKAGEAVGKGVESAGNAVGTAVTKTWKCLSSFFSDC